MALTYHAHHNVITCVCDQLITGKHTCDVKLSKIEVVECRYDSRFASETEQPCPTCIVKEGEEKYEEQWARDESDYTICSVCRLKTDYRLPKSCSCVAYIDYDGVTKCKKCHKQWADNQDVDYGDCVECGYEGGEYPDYWR